MRYYKQIDNGYITAIGTGGGGTEITETEYNGILTVIRAKPARTGNTDYRLREDLTWEAYEVPPEPEDDTPPDNLEESAAYLLKGGMVEIPDRDAESDYFNEHEPEPDYFG